MKVCLSHSTSILQGDLKITGSKSESNRVLILQALYPEIKIENPSNSDDTVVLAKALSQHEATIDIHHAGTAMRFLTAYFASQEGKKVVLTGSKRMKERPIKLLVDALKSMGADIEYANEKGYPPLKITGKKLKADVVKLKANISSQYISALMLIAPSLPNGLKINLEGQITSAPYIAMTLEILKFVGVQGNFSNNTIHISPIKDLPSKTIHIESDWSSASYFYSLVAISESAEIKLSNYRKSSLQGDSCISEIYKKLGVQTVYEENSISLKKVAHKKPKCINENLQNSPDIAQTLAVTCLALGIECKLQGLHTLKIKETDRLVALKTEMEKFGAKVKITGNSLYLSSSENLKENIPVATYNDHRMAMAFAPLALKVPLEIQDAEVVSKSYPEFWDHLKNLNFLVK